MITCSRLGRWGLANSLFQIAAVVQQADRIGTSFVLPKWQYSNVIFPEFTGEVTRDKFEQFKEHPSMIFESIPHKDNLDLDGFFQNFLHSCNSMCYKCNVEFTKTRKLSARSSTAIHVRRGDYLSPKGRHINLDISYYETAMKLMDAERYRVYSDDIDFCKQHFGASNIEFEESTDPLESLLNMSRHSNFIIANSSFSLMAAMLANRGRVIAPKVWFKPGFGIEINYPDQLDFISAVKI